MKTAERVSELIEGHLSRETSESVRTAYAEKDSMFGWAEMILIDLGFVPHWVDLDGVQYQGPETVHTGRMYVSLNYGSTRWNGMRVSNFLVSSDKTRRAFPIKNGFAKQITRRISDRAKIEARFSALKIGHGQQQVEVKAAFSKAVLGSNAPVKLNSTMEHDRHIFDMELAGHQVDLIYVDNDLNPRFDKGDLIVMVYFTASNNPNSRIEKAMRLEDFLASELIQMIYLNDALG